MPPAVSKGLPHGPAYLRLPVLPPRAVAEIKWWRHLARELKAVLGTRDLPRIRSALRAARGGFYPSTTSLYPLDSAHRSHYIPDRWRELSWVINWPAANFLDDKLAFFFMMRHFGVPTPDVVGVVIRGRIHQVGAAEMGPPAEWLSRWVEERGRLVVRPNRGTGGQRVRVIEAGPNGGCLVNGEALSWAELESRFRDSVDDVISTFVEQASYARNVFPDSTNTIRVLTMQDETGKPFIAATVHRFGTPSSAPADNFMKGGLSVPIDPESGALGAGVQKLGPQRHERHPVTGVQLTGARVPNWPQIRDGVLAAATRAAFLPFIAWDVIPTEAGFSIIEGNKNSDIQVYQVHKPMLPEARIREFYAQHGLISPAFPGRYGS